MWKRFAGYAGLRWFFGWVDWRLSSSLPRFLLFFLCTNLCLSILYATNKTLNLSSICTVYLAFDFSNHQESSKTSYDLGTDMFPMEHSHVSRLQASPHPKAVAQAQPTPIHLHLIILLALQKRQGIAAPGSSWIGGRFWTCLVSGSPGGFGVWRCLVILSSSCLSVSASPGGFGFWKKTLGFRVCAKSRTTLSGIYCRCCMVLHTFWLIGFRSISQVWAIS